MRPLDSLTWTLLGALAAVCLWLGRALHFGVPLASAALPVAGLCALAWAWMRGRSRADPRLTAGAVAFLQMSAFTILAVALSFLLAAEARPLWDARLAAADARLGIAWPTVFAAADRLPSALLVVGGVAYHSLVLQMVCAILVLAGTGRVERLRACTAAAVLAGAITVLVSGWMPALGNVFDPARYEQLWPSVAWLDRPLVLALRNGTLRHLDLLHLSGIVSFPSYHATLPVILAWGLYPVARLRIPAALWAGLTILATPLFGGHYAVDVLAGLLLALAALAAVTRMPSPSRAAEGLHNHRAGGKPPRPAQLAS